MPCLCQEFWQKSLKPLTEGVGPRFPPYGGPNLPLGGLKGGAYVQTSGPDRVLISLGI